MSSAQTGRPDDFFRTGVQYYVQGRNALLCGHESVAGSLFHQGFEVMLKAALLKPVYDKDSAGWAPSVPQPQRQAAVRAYSQRAEKLLKGLGHDLVKAWDKFKGRYSSVNLVAFDDARFGSMVGPQVPGIP